MKKENYFRKRRSESKSLPKGLTAGLIALWSLFSTSTVLIATAQEETLPTVPVDASPGNSPATPDSPEDSLENEVSPDGSTGSTLIFEPPATVNPPLSDSPAANELPGLVEGSSNFPTIPRLDVEVEPEVGLYRLGPGDVISINIFNVPEFSGPQQILVDGTVTLSLLGSVSLTGMTLGEASEELTNQYSQFLNNPIVNVILTTARPTRVNVIGEISRPGPYTVETAPAPTVTALLQNAGGVTGQADVRNIQVRRDIPGSPQQVFEVNLWALLDAGNDDTDIVLLDGDTLFVPTAVDLPDEEIFAINGSTLAPAQIQVQVMGEVRAPGAYTLPGNTPLNQAIFAAGGYLEPRANRNTVGILRLDPNGTVRRIEVPIDILASVNDDSNPTLQDSDVVLVGKSGLATFTDGLNTISSPFDPVLTIFGTVRTIQRVFEGDP